MKKLIVRLLSLPFAWLLNGTCREYQRVLMKNQNLRQQVQGAEAVSNFYAMTIDQQLLELVEKDSQLEQKKLELGDKDIELLIKSIRIRELERQLLRYKTTI